MTSEGPNPGDFIAEVEIAHGAAPADIALWIESFDDLKDFATVSGSWPEMSV